MLRNQVPVSEVQSVLESVGKRKRLATMVSTMAQEIERLGEDNLQLRSAVALYREVLRRYTGDLPA